MHPLLKVLPSLGDLPNVETADSGMQTKAERIQSWKVSMAMKLRTTRTTVTEWWDWTVSVADRCYRRWTSLPVNQRVGLDRVTDAVPRRWEFIDSWFMPRILKAMTSRLHEQIKQEQTYGQLARVVEILFSLLKHIRPDSVEDKMAVFKQLTPPQPVS